MHIPGSSVRDLFGVFKWTFQGLSDLHLGDQEVTWKKLVYIYTIIYVIYIYPIGIQSPSENDNAT